MNSVTKAFFYWGLNLTIQRSTADAGKPSPELLGMLPKDFDLVEFQLYCTI
jgi:hypothetical protein